MAREPLLDTRAFVSLVDRSARQHSECVAVLEGWRGPVVTTEAVLTETLHLVGPGWENQRVCPEVFPAGSVRPRPLFQKEPAPGGGIAPQQVCPGAWQLLNCISANPRSLLPKSSSFSWTNTKYISVKVGPDTFGMVQEFQQGMAFIQPLGHKLRVFPGPLLLQHP